MSEMWRQEGSNLVGWRRGEGEGEKQFLGGMWSPTFVLELWDDKLVEPHGRSDDLKLVHALGGLADQDEVSEQEAVHIRLQTFVSSETGVTMCMPSTMPSVTMCVECENVCANWDPKCTECDHKWAESDNVC